MDHYGDINQQPGGASAFGTPGGSGLSGTAVVTLPAGQGVFEWTETVVAAGVVTTDMIMVHFAAGGEDDENTAEFLDPSNNPVAVAETDALTISVFFRELTSGPIKLNWKVI